MKRPSNQLLNFRKLLPAIVYTKKDLFLFEKSGSPDPVTEPALMQVVIAKMLPQIQLAPASTLILQF